MGKYYAVRVGVRPGIYTTWNECQQQVHGYPGAVFKKFETVQEAEAFCRNDDDGKMRYDPTHMPETYAFVDGSFNPKTKVYGCGGFLIHNGEEYVIQSSGNDPEMAAMRNVAGEILGAKQAIYLATDIGAKSLTIFYDYSGVEKWATGEWSADKIGTKAYVDFVQEVKKTIALSFVHVPGHTGIEGNEEADRLAKIAVGIEKKKRKKKQIWALVSNYNPLNSTYEPMLATFPSQEDAYGEMERQYRNLLSANDSKLSEDSYINEAGAICKPCGDSRSIQWKIQRI